MTYIVTLLCGFAIGYLVFERPQWATGLIAKVMDRMGGF